MYRDLLNHGGIYLKWIKVGSIYKSTVFKTWYNIYRFFSRYILHVFSFCMEILEKLKVACSMQRFKGGAINFFYYISKLLRALWLVKLEGRTLLHGPLKFKVFLVARLLRDLCHQIFTTYIAKKSLKLSFTLNCVLKRANDLKTISNWRVLLSTCFRNFPNPSDTQ